MQQPRATRVFRRDVSFLWSFLSALLWHLLCTFPIIIVLIIGLTEGEGIVKLVESPLYVPGLFIATFGITLVVVVFGRVSKYEINESAITCYTPLFCLCPRNDLDIQAGPVTNVRPWDDCSRLWHGQYAAPVEVTHKDHFWCGAKRSYYLFPEEQEREALLAALERRIQALAAQEARPLLAGVPNNQR